MPLFCPVWRFSWRWYNFIIFICRTRCRALHSPTALLPLYSKQRTRKEENPAASAFARPGGVVFGIRNGARAFGRLCALVPLCVFSQGGNVSLLPLCALVVLDNAFNIPLFKLLCVLCVSERIIGGDDHFLFIGISEIVLHEKYARDGIDLSVLHIIDHL